MVSPSISTLRRSRAHRTPWLWHPGPGFGPHPTSERTKHHKTNGIPSAIEPTANGAKPCASGHAVTRQALRVGEAGANDEELLVFQGHRLAADAIDGSGKG